MDDIRELPKKEFPALLREMPGPPTKLYIRGTLPPSDHKLLTVVGSRRMSTYGKEACEQLIKGLAGYPVAVVSGLALGIDGTAHKAALAANIPTIAVPGSGLSDSVLYPRAHVRLAHEIVESGGALLSEMEPEESAMPYSFPKRNRIMAGMAHATLIIEAGVKSGTLITAKLASDYGRELLIVPHSIFAEGGAGGHVFMKIGAAPIRTSEDILEALGFEIETEERALPELSAEEKKVFDALMEPIPRDELIRMLAMPVADANVLLAMMEIKGLIQESTGMLRKKL